MSSSLSPYTASKLFESLRTMTSSKVVKSLADLLESLKLSGAQIENPKRFAPALTSEVESSRSNKNLAHSRCEVNEPIPKVS